MKAHFKYIFRAEAMRLIVFAAVFVVNLVFVVLAALGVLPLAAQIVAVSLSSLGVNVMFVFNVIGDISIINRLFSPRSSIIYALTPAPRKERLLASIISMTVMDIVTMAGAMIGVAILGIHLGGNFAGLNFWEMLSYPAYTGSFYFSFSMLIPIALMLAGYLYLITLITFCISVRKSMLYNKPAGGFLAFLVALGVIYITNISSFLLAPFGSVSRFFTFFTIDVGTLGMAMYALLTFIFAAVMFVLTARLMERKLNI